MLGAEEAACCGVGTAALLGTQFSVWSLREESEMHPQLRLKIGRILQEKAGMGFPGQGNGLSKGAEGRSNRGGQRSCKQFGEGVACNKAAQESS